MDASTKALVASVAAALISAAATLGASYMNLIKPSEKQVNESRVYISQAEELKAVSDQLAQEIARSAQLRQRVQELEARLSKTSDSSSVADGCSESMKLPNAVEIGSAGGTSEAVFELPSSPCSRDIAIQLAGTAVATANVGVRAADWVLLAGEKEICKASGSLRPVYLAGREFSGQARCTINIASGKAQSFTAKLAGASNSKSTKIQFSLLSTIK